MPSTNFLQWNPPCTNQESDAAYAADSQRASGAPSSAAMFSGQLANKLFFQTSTFIAAFCSWLVTNGFSPNDGNTNPGTAVANLAAVFQSAIALLNSPQFSGAPTSTTPATNDNSTKIATTAFVQAKILADAMPVLTAGGSAIAVPQIVIGSFSITVPVGTGVAGFATVAFTGAARFISTPTIVLTPICGNTNVSFVLNSVSVSGFQASMISGASGTTYTVNFIAIGE